MKKLTIGCATHNDYDGLYFTIQNIRLNNPEILNDVEFVIVDNNPASEHGVCNRKLTDWIKEPFQYLPFTKYQSTSVKNKVFELADTPYVICMDSHVLVERGALAKLIQFYDDNKDDNNLLQGPLLHDDIDTIATHFDLVWDSFMWGKWGKSDLYVNKYSEPFEIPAQGMGLFSCRKDAWLGFHKDFRGFGGEEGYIHEKYRKYGKKTICLPFLRWVHRFDRPNGTSYPNSLQDRYNNYKIGFEELGLDTEELKKHFKGHVIL